MDFSSLQDQLDREGVFRQLEILYSQLPSGSCHGCATCCYDGVTASFVEYMNIRRYFSDHLLLTEELKEHIREYVLNELKEVNPCPFLVAKRCLIYPVRPLTCRLFGFQSRHEQNQRRKTLIKAHVEKETFYRETYDYTLPEAVVLHVIPFCQDFVSNDSWHIGKSRGAYDALMGLDAPYFIAELVKDQYFNKSLVDWVLIEMGEESDIYQKRLKRLMKK